MISIFLKIKLYPEKGTFLPKDKTLELAIKFRMFFLHNSKLNFETECNSILCLATSLDSNKDIVMGVLHSMPVHLLFFSHLRLDVTSTIIEGTRDRGKGDISSHNNLNCIFLKQNNTFCCNYQKQPFYF